MQADTLPPELTEDTFRFMTEGDLDRMVELGDQFFKESEFTEFATFDSDQLRKTLNFYLHIPSMKMFVFAPEGKVQGFFGFTVDNQYTKEPMALGWLFFVTPEYRKSPAGRTLLGLAIDYAEHAGCCAFYSGTMSGIEGVAKTMPNLYKKFGFEPCYWGRKIMEKRT